MKTMKNFKPEILAPVGNKGMLLAAVRSGADAVYLGAENFNARRNAENFSEAELRESIRYCHINNVLVYLTLNTIVRDDELDSACETAEKAYKAGIDAVIVADLGLAARLHKTFPDLPLHASTQMTVHSVSALPTLSKMGFARVVISREMDRESIKEFTAKARSLGIETEVFVHGALCMSVSGQCLLSSVIGGRSGNRGLCAGPCRLPFSIGKNEYVLSLKDLSLLGFVKELKEMGVASFKIEGRMKRPEYVAAAVTAFKAAINCENTEKYNDILKNVFSRSGFTSGYFENKLGSHMFGIRTKDDVIAAGNTLSEIHEFYRNELQRVPIEINAGIFALKNTKVTLFDGVNTVEATGDIPQTAQNKALTEETVEAALTKLGATPYFAKEVKINLDDGLFLSGSQLNELRRKAVEKLNDKRAGLKPVKKEEYIADFTERKAEKTELICRFESPELIPDNLSGIPFIVLPLFADFNNIKVPDSTKIAVELPRGILNEEIISKKLKNLKEFGIKTAFCGTISGKELAEKEGFRVVADIGFNVYNSETAKTLEELGAYGVMLSPELKSQQIRDIKSPLLKGVFAYGRLPLMLTRNCPVKDNGCSGCNKDRHLTDRMGIQFPVRCVNGFSEVFNSKPHYTADKKSEFKGIDFMYLYFTFEQKDEIKEIIEAYKNEKKPSGEFTRGLYFRDVY